MTAPSRHRPRGIARRGRIAISGGGVAAIEALLAVRALLGRAPHVDLIAPKRRFVYQPLAVAEPFGLVETAWFDLATVAAEHRAQLHVASLEAVQPGRHRIALSGGATVLYESLIIAVGARQRAWLPGGVDFRGAEDVSSFRELLAALQRGELARLAFAAPPGSGWTLPTYELALLTASFAAGLDRCGVELTIVTPEQQPLASFGPAASRAMREVLDRRGIRLRVAAMGEEARAGELRLAGGDVLPTDRVIALPQLTGAGIEGVPVDQSGFIEVDEYARVVGLDDVYAAGDATAFPIKQGGIATQQADVAVEGIAARAGAGPKPSAFQPVLRAILLTGVAPTYLRAALAPGAVNHEAPATTPLWWPPTKIAGRYLGPYVARAMKAGGPPASSDDPRAMLTGHREARELALTFARADANSNDYRSALRWLEVVERLDGGLPPGYSDMRAEWRRRALV